MDAGQALLLPEAAATLAVAAGKGRRNGRTARSSFRPAAGGFEGSKTGNHRPFGVMGLSPACWPISQTPR